MLCQSFLGQSRLPRLAIAAVALFALLSIQVTQASTVTFSLEYGGGSWQLFGEASLGDNAGLQLVAVELTNIDEPVDLQLPVSIFDGSGSPIEAFTQFPSAISPVGGSQDLGGAGVVYNFGQSAGSLLFTGAGITNVQPNYAAKLLIAQGSYPGAAPAFGAVDARVYDMAMALTTQTPSFILNVVSVPEPSSGAIAFVALLAYGYRGYRRHRVLS